MCQICLREWKQSSCREVLLGTRGHRVSEGIVRNFKCKYLEQLKCVGDPDLITSLPSASCGRPLLIGKFDDKVAKYIRNLRLSGGIVNTNILIAAALFIKSWSFQKLWWKPRVREKMGKVIFNLKELRQEKGYQGC